MASIATPFGSATTAGEGGGANAERLRHMALALTGLACEIAKRPREVSTNSRENFTSPAVTALNEVAFGVALGLPSTLRRMPSEKPSTPCGIPRSWLEASAC